MLKIFFITLIISSLFSCENRRNPNLSERRLAALMSNTASPEPTSETSVPDFIMPEGYTPQPGVKYRQERDVSVPPVRIDVVKGIENVRNVALSEIATGIMYINAGKHRFSPKAQITRHGILVSNLDGAWLYSSDGQLIKEIYKNFHEHRATGRWGVAFVTGDRFTGIERVRYNEKNDRLWLKFKDEKIGTDDYRGHLGYIDMRQQLNVTYNDELRQVPVIPLATLGKGNLGYADDFIIQYPDYQNPVLITKSFSGDTLCRFIVGRDTVTAQGMRNSMRFDGGNEYYYRGTYSFRPPHNDTLFRLTAANVLKPKYIIDMGTWGRASNQGKPSDVNVNTMYVLNTLHEDDRFLYIRFSISNYAGSNVSRQWHGLYEKQAQEFFTLPSDFTERLNFRNGIENDIDGGLPFWAHDVGNQGEKYVCILGGVMKNVLTEEWFAKSKASKPDKKAELLKFMQTVEDDDSVIIIVK